MIWGQGSPGRRQLHSARPPFPHPRCIAHNRGHSVVPELHFSVDLPTCVHVFGGSATPPVQGRPLAAWMSAVALSVSLMGVFSAVRGRTVDSTPDVCTALTSGPCRGLKCLCAHDFICFFPRKPGEQPLMRQMAAQP